MFFKVAPSVTIALMLVGFGLMFVMAISPLWGWHPILGWSTSISLVVIFFDKKVGFFTALKQPWKKNERLVAFYLLSLAVISIAVNLGATLLQIME